MDSTAGDSTASSLSDSRRDKEESLRRRRERDRVRRASETEAQKKERLRVRRERDRARRAARSEEQRSRVLLRKRAHFQDSVASESIEARELRLQRLSSNQRERLAAESEEERQARLQHLSANQHERLAAESEEERQARLQHLSARQHERLAAESEEERQARLQHLRANQHERLAAESEEERQARLQHLRANQHERLAAESEEERQARLQQQCLYHQERLAAECVVDREARLQADRERHRAQRSVQPQLSLFEQYSVRQKMVAFHRHLATLAISNCTTCSEGFPGLECCRTTECRRCSQDKHIPKLYSTANNMNPGVVPLQLQGLSQVEEMLVSAIMPIMSIYQLPLGQYGYKGHVINLPQDVISFARSLPRLPSELDVLVVRKEQEQSHRDFRVRRFVVQEALKWLLENNKYYRANQVHLDAQVLQQLPENGDITSLTSLQLEGSTSEDFSQPSQEDLYRAHLPCSFVPNAVQQQTEQETVRQSIQERQSTSTSTLMWPTIGGAPINEFTTEGYFSMAFPTLFPTGAADFLGQRCNQVTIGNYFKHLLMYEDGRFARHPRFRFFALNTEMRWRALQAGRIYIRQHPGDAQLTVDELRDMVGREGEAFSNRVLHYATSLRGTRQYWMRQRSRLVSMIDTLGLPTIFFTHSAADLQWPELAHLICPEDPNTPATRVKAVNENPAIADWFFCHRVQKFLDAFYVGVLQATDYWLRFEWQHRGSPHVHGVAWLPNAPDVKQLLASAEVPESLREEVIQHVDRTVTTLNPALSSSADSDSQFLAPVTNPHVCNKSYLEVEDHHQDLCELVATCQRHTRCSEAYCLRTQHGRQECRFGYPKPLQPKTTIVTDAEPTLLTARNDGLLNSFNPVQLSGWRANVDMQYIVSRRRVVDYCTKYVTKSEPRSETLKDTFTRIVRGLKEGNQSLKAVQKLLIHSVGDRDYSAQETCHILLQLPMFRSSREFIVLSLNGFRAVEDHLQQGGRATAPSIVDHYIARPAVPHLISITLLEFARQFTMPKELGAEPNRRRKKVVVIARPYCSPDPAGPMYEQYCHQSLMQHKTFRQVSELLAGHETYAQAYTEFLQTGNIPPSLEEDIFRLQQLQSTQAATQNEEEEDNEQPTQSQPPQAQEEWMLICQGSGDLQPDSSTQEDFDWTAAAQSYPNLEEAPSFVIRHRQQAAPHIFTTTANPDNLQGTQLDVYSTVRAHFTTDSPNALRLIITGTAGTGKSFLIHCLRLLLGDTLKVAAPTGVASFIIDGTTLHSLLHLPTKGEFKELEGNRLLQLQQVMSTVRYIIIDEMSMVGRKVFGQIDRRLRQAFPHHAQEVFGGCSLLLFGDFAQLPPVMDLPLYTTDTRSDLSDQGRTAYLQFDKAFTLTQIMRQAGNDPDQVHFRDILLRLRNARVTVEDWNCLMKQTPTEVPNVTPFANALRLHPTVEAVVQYNVATLQATGQPIATIKAVHTGANAAKASSDDASGLEAVVCLAKSARIMLTSNLWVEVGLVNGAMGTIEAICYRSGGPPDLPLAVMVKFDQYSGPTLHDGTVPITPLRRTWSNSGVQCSRLQLPLKLAWAVTIHKSQGLTLDKVVIDVGKKEFACGLTYVACSRVRKLTDVLFSPPFPFQRLSGLANSQRLLARQLEDQRLLTMQPPSQHSSSHTSYELTPILPPMSRSPMDSLPTTCTPLLPSRSSCSCSSISPPLSPMDSLPTTLSPPPRIPMDYLPCTPSPPSSCSTPPNWSSMDYLHTCTPSPPSSRSCTPPHQSPMDYLPCTPSPPSSRSCTPPPQSPMDYLPCTPSPPSSRSSTPPPLSPMDDLPCTPSPPVPRLSPDSLLHTPSPPSSLASQEQTSPHLFL